VADDEGAMEEGTYPKQKGKGGGKHNGGIVDEMCSSACKNKKGENKKKFVAGPKGSMSYGQANQ
jgi:hypothetical protein